MSEKQISPPTTGFRPQQNRIRKPKLNATNGINANEEPQHISLFGEWKLNEFSTPELRKRLHSAEGGFSDEKDRIHQDINKLIEMQDKEEPLRKELEALDKKTVESLGLLGGESILDSLKKGKISPPSISGVIGAGRSFFKAQRKDSELKKMHDEGVVKGLNKLDHRYEQLSIWSSERQRIEEILNYRDGKRQQNQRKRRRQGF